MASMAHRAAQRRATASGGGPQPFERAAAEVAWNGPGPVVRQGSETSQISPAGSGEMQRGWSVDLSDPSDSASGAAASPTSVSRTGSGTANGGSGRTVFSNRAAARHNLQSLPEGLAELSVGASSDDSSKPQSRHGSETSQSRLGPRQGSDGEPKVQVALDALAAGLVAGAGPAGGMGGTGQRRVNGSRSMFAAPTGNGSRGTSVGAANGGGGSGTLGGLTRGSASRASASGGSPQPASTLVRPSAGPRASQARAALSPGAGGAAFGAAANGADSPMQALAGLGGGAVNSRGLALRRQLKEEDFSGSAKREEWVVPGAAQPAEDDSCNSAARQGGYFHGKGRARESTRSAVQQMTGNLTGANVHMSPTVHDRTRSFLTVHDQAMNDCTGKFWFLCSP